MFDPRLAKLLFAVIAIVTAGAAIYAWFWGEAEARKTAIVGLVLLVPLAAFFGVFRIGSAEGAAPPQKAAPLPVDSPDSAYLALAAKRGITSGDQFRVEAKTLTRDTDLPALNRNQIKRIALHLDAQQARAEAFTRTGEVTLVRLPHAQTDVTKEGTSWFGGTPALGDIAWPRGADGQPLHHLAHINLADLHQMGLPPGVPRQGALAFFVSTTGDQLDQGKVIYSAQPAQRPMKAPKNLPPLYDGPHWPKLMTGQNAKTPPTVFPRWPVSPLGVPVSDPDSAAMANAYLASKFPKQNTTRITTRSYATTMPAFAGPYYWDTAQRFAHSLIQALDENDSSDDFAAFVDEVTGWAFEYDGWGGMIRTEVDLLQLYFAQVQPTGQHQPRFAAQYQGTKGALDSLTDASDATLIAAATGDYSTYISLPDAVRSDIDAHWRLPATNRRHQMFGTGTNAGGADIHAHDHLLLQLQSDALHHWFWGDGAVIQFWISDADLAAGNWDAVQMTTRTG